jgi:GMP synthase (glutamine-hydrolysing)
LRIEASQKGELNVRTVAAIRHVHFEDLGTLEPLLRQRDYEIRYVDAGVHDLGLLNAHEPDLLVVLGGPIGAFDEAIFPFLATELALIRERLEARLPILGICLGAQLMARALGAGVAPMGVKEIGFGPLMLTAAGRESVLSTLAGVPVLHWHGDRFDTPANANLLASTTLCAHQAFAHGDHALALQFHLETDTNCIERWLVGHACELAQAGVDPRQIREQAALQGPALKAAATRTIGPWLDRIEASLGHTVSRI